MQRNKSMFTWWVCLLWSDDGVLCLGGAGRSRGGYELRCGDVLSVAGDVARDGRAALAGHLH